MTESWIPKEGESIEVLDNSYSNCPTKPMPGAVGTVKQHHISEEGHRVLVITFVTMKKGKLPETFKEYFDVERLPYLYFTPTRATILGK